MKKYLFFLIVFAVIEISLALFLTFWRNWFWDAVAAKESLQFIQQLGIFTAVAIGICFVSGVSGYILSLCAIEWRKKLNEKALSVSNSEIENVSQRIQDDCLNYPTLMLNICYGGVKSVFYILVFSISLVIYFHWWYLLVLVGYTIVGSVLTSYIAKPLIKLNYEQQRVEATYRSRLSVEIFKECVHIMLGIAKRTKKLTYFQTFYMQLAVVVPLIMIAPVYFTTATFTIGLLMRYNSICSTILENLSYGVSSFGTINLLLSCRKRLKEIKVI